MEYNFVNYKAQTVFTRALTKINIKNHAMLWHDFSIKYYHLSFSHLQSCEILFTHHIIRNLVQLFNIGYRKVIIIKCLNDFLH